MGHRAVVGFFMAVLGVVLTTGAAGQGSDPAKPEPSRQTVHRSAPEALQHLQPAPHLVKRLGYNLQKQYYKSLGFKSNDIADLLGPPPDMEGLPTTGTVHIPVLVIAFPDRPAVHANAAAIAANCNGPGNTALWPYDSLAQYYQRSSYNQLNLVFDVYYDYVAPQNRAQYAADSAAFLNDPQAVCPAFDSDSQEVIRRNLMSAAIQHYDSEGADFSQYDNEPADGTIDKLIFLWTGNDDPNGGFWSNMSVRACSPWTVQVDGKNLQDYIWSAEESLGDSLSNLSNNVLIHELGHALGLPDYYDRDESIGPDGGVGQLDMMDRGGRGDHNCFSKLLLGWIDPYPVTTFGTTYGFNLTSSGSDGAQSAVLVMPGFDPANPFGEFFMVQNRYRTGNDLIVDLWQSIYPSDGLLIWHVDATLDADGQNFKYNNSNTARKLLRLMEADGLEEIEAGDGTQVNAGDYYTDGEVFGPQSTPKSARYNGAGTGITVDSISQSRIGEVYCEVKIVPAQGDLDYDGDVDAADLLRLAQILAGSLGLVDPVMANMYYDALVNSADLIVGQQYLAGNISAPLIATGAGTIYTTDPIVGELRYVPAGTFIQGSPADEPCRASDESQFTHTLTRDLAVMETEVTRQMWADLKAVQPTLPADPTNTSYGSGTTNPVQNNTWYEAVLFANLLSVQNGLPRCYYTDTGFTTPITSANYTSGPFYCNWNATGYRLPLEGEWEYYCRAGTTTPFWIAEPNYGSGNCSVCNSGLLPNLETVAVFCANDSNISSAVATKSANPWGLHDTNGNVWEWCWDRWSGTYPTGSATDYTGATYGSYRVYRGGSWYDGAYTCRSAHRSGYTPGYRHFSMGFRLVRTIG